jgi:hypothetical protein
MGCRWISGAWRIGVALALGACGADTPTAPAIQQRVVVHAVLDPRSPEQIVLVERTQVGDGTVTAHGTTSDPIAASGGTPISGARVVITDAEGDSAVAVEDLVSRGDGKGAGVYRLRSHAVASLASNTRDGTLRLAPGRRYRLRVETPLGVVRGATRVPRFNLALDRTLRRFNLDTDSLCRARAYGEGGGPAGYLLRHEIGGLIAGEKMQMDSNAVLLAPAAASDERTWSFAYSRRMIRPGIPQRFVVVAVDSNYYEYSVAGYDPFGHDARGNRLEGGVGLFGAVVMQVDANLDLVATRDHAIEGDWAPTIGTTTLPVTLRLYESPRFPGPTSGPGLHLWGSARMPNGDALAVEASVVGDTVQFQLTRAGSSTVRRLTGSFDGSLLTVTLPGSGITIRYALKS